MTRYSPRSLLHPSHPYTIPVKYMNGTPKRLHVSSLDIQQPLDETLHKYVKQYRAHKWYINECLRYHG